MTPRFEKAYNALVKGFFEGTLAKETCVACAVGNIIADAQGGVIRKNKSFFDCSTDNSFWARVFMTDGAIQRINIDNKTEQEQIFNLTGYEYGDLAKVEFAFERNTQISYDEYCDFSEKEILEDQYNGLCAVVDVLLSLDNIEEQPTYKAKFREHKTLQPC